MNGSRGAVRPAWWLAAVVLALAAIATVVVMVDRWPWEDAAVSRHDRVTAWLTCHGFLRDSVPEASLRASPWAAAQEHVQLVEGSEATYWASGRAGYEGRPDREVRFDCEVEWRRGGWHLRSLDAVVVAAPEAAETVGGPPR